MSGNFVGGIVGGIIGGTVGLVGSIKGIRDTKKAMKDSYLRQMSVLMQNYNYNQNALSQEERFSLDQAKKNLFNITFQGIQNNAGVEAALAETGTEGRTSNQISRALTGQVSRQKTGVIENYEQQMYQIKRQKDNLYIETKRTIDQAEDNFENMQSSDLENVFNVLNTSAMAGYQGFMIGSGIGGGFSGGASGGESMLSGSFQGVGSSSGSSMLSGSFQGVGSSSGSSMLSGSFANTYGASFGGGLSFSWGKAMDSFGQTYAKYSSIQNMFGQFGALGQSIGALFGNARNNRYSFI